MENVEVRKGQMVIAKPSGPAIAAMLSAMLGLLTMAMVNLGTELSASFKDTVHGIGKLWMPGAQGIGPYSGKETIALVTWLVTWVVLYKVLQKKEVDERVWGIIFLVGIGIATTLFWPPIIELIAS